MRDAESVKFLIDYLEKSLEEKDDYSVAWVAIQINMPSDSTPTEIREKLDRILNSTVAASRFGV